MNAAFEHIAQARFILARIFESGFYFCGNVGDEIKDLKKQAEELALGGGAELLNKLGAELAALRAGAGSVSGAAIVYSNLISYYRMISKALILETLSIIKQDCCSDGQLQKN